MKKKSIENTYSNLPLEVLIGLLLVFATAAVYWQVSEYGFVNCDDDSYVTANRHVQTGFTRENVIWSFQTFSKSNWHPLTWISHMLDVTLYGMQPGMHHLTNLVFHISNSLLLWIVLKQMSKNIWRSGMVALLFAIHPLHVESVAWISERKDVLSTFFWMLSMWSYSRYVATFSNIWYLAALMPIILGLMAKPMLVTLPFVLLLIDYWPLERLEIQGVFRITSSEPNFSLSKLVVEKIPFFAFSAASCVVTFYAQYNGGTVASLDTWPLGWRISNTLVAYVSYIGKMFWPANLIVFYPHASNLPLWQTAGAGAILVSIFILCLVTMRRIPFLTVGWLWYVGTLIPAIGLVQVGAQALADRYTYIPLIGLFIIVAWGLPDLSRQGSLKKIGWVVIMAAILSSLMLLTWIQTQYWKNSTTLFEHALSVTPQNWLAHNNLGNALAKQGNLNKAYRHFAEAHRLYPHDAHVQLNYGNALLAEGKFKQAEFHMYAALRIQPGLAEAHNNLGLILIRSGKIQKGIEHFKSALLHQPGYTNALRNLKLAQSIIIKIAQAADGLSEALAFSPADSQLDEKIAEVLRRKHKLNQTILQFQRSLQRQPGYLPIDINDIEVLSTVRNQYRKTLPMFKKIIGIKPDSSGAYYIIACIYGSNGNKSEAVIWLKKALQKGFDNWKMIRTEFDLEAIRILSDYDR
jgi:tetratricopeptide (TPR) repeat protein